MMPGASTGARRAGHAPASAPRAGGSPSSEERWIAVDVLVPAPRRAGSPEPGAGTADAFRLATVHNLTVSLAEVFPGLPLPRTLRVGAVILPPSWDRPARTALADHDPAALRLALLHFRYSDTAVLSAARLHRAEQTLGRWRFKIALWHDMPPAPPIPGVVAAARAAFADDLDTPAVLRELHRLEIDQHAASGSKFTTFSSVDRVLGLDLTYLVGKVLR